MAQHVTTSNVVPRRPGPAALVIGLSLLVVHIAGCVGYGDWKCSEALEVCNGIDDNCDGEIDLDATGSPLVRDCSNVCGAGEEQCVDGEWVSCTAPQPFDETCNGVDDDCDGEVDEDCECVHGETRRCSTGELGTCEDGMQMCDEGEWSACVAQGDPSERVEICDGRDNDCDGEVDEGLDCPCDTVEHGGHIYLFCPEPDTWQGALEACGLVGLSLVSIDSSEENTFVGDEAWNRVTSVWWIGLNDRAQEGVYRWGDAGPLATFTSWADNEPNNANDEEDCVVTDYAFYGGWNDDGCSKTWPYVCEGS